MKKRLAVTRGILVLAGAALASPVAAKSLSWRSIEVRASIDAEGLLHVAERQNIIFDGDWNGGERIFRIAPGQELHLERVSRIDNDSGASTPLTEGSLSAVDEYSLVEAGKLRWRSRLPSDPPFENREIDYLLEYTISGVLLKKGDAYLLNHDFAFADRTGAIGRFTLDLELAPAWSSETPLQKHQETGPLAPGQSFIVHASLRFVGAGVPAAVRTIPPFGDHQTAALVVAGALLLFVALYYAHEQRRGRFEPLPPVDDIDDAWLEKNFFNLLPEEAGAAWDDDIGTPEISAIFARLVAERKLKSELTAGAKDSLRLTLLQPRTNFSGYERKLIDGFFFGDRKEVTPADLKDHYRATGFSPRGLIEKDLKASVDAKLGPSQEIRVPMRWRSLPFFLAGIACGVAALRLKSPVDRPPEVVFLFASLFLGLLGITLCTKSRDTFRPANGLLVAGTLLVLVPWVIVGALMTAAYSPLILWGITLFTIGMLSSAFLAAISREGAARMERRRRLVSARNFFLSELGKAHPRLKDEWFPYLVAMELNSDVDKWSKSFGGVSRGTAAASTFSSSSGAGSSSESSAGWTGGGGSFGGAGASAGWAAAVGGLASGVAAPSSSGSGGGGGGSSSGGGGGGGW